MNKKGYPNGNPEDDRQRLQAWWLEEIESCKFKGNVEVEYAASDEVVKQKSVTNRIFDAISGINIVKFVDSASTVNAHLYHSVIPHPRWPMEALVSTTHDGLVTDILYEATIDRLLPSPVRFTYKQKTFSWKWVVTGDGTSELEGNKKLLKIIKKNLCHYYKVPSRGFVMGATTYIRDGIFIDLTPDGGKTRVTACTTPRTAKAFIGLTWSLGLAPVTELFEAIEKTLDLQAAA